MEADALDELLQRRQAEFAQTCAQLPALAALLDERLHAELQQLWLASDYAAGLCSAEPALLQDLLESGDLEREGSADPAALARIIARLLPQAADAGNDPKAERLKRELRLVRKREMLRILWRDTSGRADLLATCRDLSCLADACIHYALARLSPLVQHLHGLPLDQQGREQELIVLAMGKYGAFELNLSSDIDLIFAFPEDGDTTIDEAFRQAHPHARSCTIQQYFSKLGQLLIAALDTTTADGYVFRVDMRLRPYGGSGALALSIDAMEEYYQSQGRDWERFAMIKARAVTGQPDYVQALMTMLRSFTYRRYIDFATIESLRDLKRQIEQQVRRKGMHDNIKLGRGGIREVEFVVQVQQLVYGGRYRHLQQAGLFAAMDGLVLEHSMPEADAQALKTAYLLLRRVEHAVQALQDKQTHDFPREPELRARIALALRFDSVAALEQELQEQRDIVAALFTKVIADPEQQDASNPDTVWQQLWRGQLEREKSVALLAAQGFRDADALLGQLEQYRGTRAYVSMDATSRQRMDRFMPRLLARLGKEADPDLAFERVFVFVQAVARRTVYLVLLMENPLALSQLILLCSTSPWILEHLSRYPALLDELLRPLQAPPARAELQDLLRQSLLRSATHDIEDQLATIQHFKQEQVLVVAAAELAQTLPLMKVSDSLTWIAEAILEQVLDMAWQQLVQKYGEPCNADGSSGSREFLIIGYGKLGGIELNYGSDLDLVFMHNGHPDRDTSGGANGAVVNSGAFYVQLGQKVLSLLNTHTLSGRLYEIDMRLRPSGASGALVCTPEAFRDYQEQHAWTWEHQALVRARAVAGHDGLAERFAEMRRAILGKERDEARLASDIVSMRARMRRELGSRKGTDGFHLKQDSGGLVDIEFIVQYLVLRHAHAWPDLLLWSDNMRLLDTIAEHGILPPDEAQVLQTSYIAYRSLLHKRALDNAEYRLEGKAFAEERAAVTAIWERLFRGIEPGALHEHGSGAPHA